MVNKTFSKCLCVWGVSFLCLFLVFMAAYPQPVPGKKETLSRSSYALVIGIDDYENWPDPNNAISNASRVGNELEKLGFAVTYRTNLNLIEIESAIKKFLSDKDVDEKSNLFLWFSGHGDNIGKQGFLVPSDAPPKNDRGFKMKAFPVRRLEEYLRETKAKHVFLVFDACFTGTIFGNPGSDSPVKAVAEMLKYPVHRYLYYSSAGQQRKVHGALGEIFIKTLRNEDKADANRDNYLTAREIKEKIMKNFAGKVQLKSGKLEGFDRGEFVFSLPGQSLRYFNDPFTDGDNGQGPQMIKIPGGSFMMGDSQGTGFRDEKPVHLVSVSPIAVSCFEITFEEYDRFCEATKRRKPEDNGWGRGDRPVIYVSWLDAAAYTKWLTEQTGFQYRLPTEAEWEYFACSGSDTDYWWGNKIGREKACCDGCGAKWGWDAEKSTAPVGSFKSNKFGIHDTVGNAWEWTCSEYTPGYNESKKEENCLGKIKTGGELVVLRGGAWNEKPGHCRVSRRRGLNPGERSPYIGFRVVRELK
ncbi:MAG: SUMF1/EgtB/PvdO family nonheme iron enzyme [Candidatus Aminicenantes bacterium]|nr:SUMF1/EgtB/PvdO family nonheme iron enzyme [Candidatus Aminicenantes bacterium]